MISLANKYRPKTFEDVVEQEEIKIILQNQLKNNDIRNAYLFVGGAGTGKTTCARIFSKELNEGAECAIEIDGATYNGVDQVREIGEQARTTSIVGKYKVFIIDECHMITTQGWNAMLKLIEEPPLNTIFIFCTTNPEKIPNTILSRVQRYDFSAISTESITERLKYIVSQEEFTADTEALCYIAKLANGHLRNAITMLDKCVAFNNHITLETITKSLGLCYQGELKDLMLYVTNCEDYNIVTLLENLANLGVDFRELIKEELEFALDYNKWKITGDIKYCNCPDFCEEWFKKECCISSDIMAHYLDTLLKLNSEIKYDHNPKVVVETTLLLESDFIRGQFNE